MTPERLYQIAQENHIPIVRFDLPENGSISLRFPDGRTVIGLDRKKMETRREVQHLAHELGHCMTGSFYNLDSPYDIRCHHEYRANKWAAMLLMPPKEVQGLLSEGCEVWQIADHFDVDLEYAVRTLQLYQENDLLE